MTRFAGRREWILAITAVALIILQVYLDISIPDFMNKITEALLVQNTDVVVKYGTEMVIYAFFSLILALAAGIVISNVAASVGRNMRIAQFDAVQSFATEDINRFSAASLITRSTNDVYQIQNFIARGMQVLTKSPILAIFALYMIWGKAVEWTMIVVVAIIVVFIVIFTSLRFSIPKFKKVQWLTDGVNRSTRENLDGIRVIRAYNAEEYQEVKFDKANGELLQNNLDAARYMAPAFPVIQSLINFVTLAIYWVGAGVIASISGEPQQLTYYSDMVVFVSYATMVVSSFTVFIGIFRMLPRAMVGLKRIKEVINTVPSIEDGDATEGVVGKEGTIEFEHVSFTYPGTEKKVLEDISFTVEKGRTFAIIGSTGSGKTTVMNLIARFYDADEGCIRVDGKDVRDYSIRSLHLKLGYVPQRAIIFSGSVDLNVNYGYGSDTRTEEQVRRALRIAQAEDFVEAMPEGRKSHISQHGRNISGGQKQRISIARAICRDPEIYLLDDTFSALDYKTDKILRQTLREETAGSTVLIVAQRIGTIMDADEIIVLDEGRIVGRGTHRELLKDCPLYMDIARSQLTEEELQ